MNIAYIYLKNGYIHVRYNKIHIKFMAAYSLQSIDRIVSYNKDVGLITFLGIYKLMNNTEKEEDYLDLLDLFNEFGYDGETLIRSISTVVLGEPHMVNNTQKLINEAIMVSDRIALKYYINTQTGNPEIMATSLSRQNCRARIDLRNCKVIDSNMSDTMQKRAEEAIRMNRHQIIELVKAGVTSNAEVY